MAISTLRRPVAATVMLLALAACQGTGPFALSPRSEAQATRFVERDVEAPEVFQRTADGLWSGTPSFGGVWVAHADADAPERVIIRNEQNGAFVIGSLFRRDAEAEGPPFQISSDAAAALEAPAETPIPLNVTALRRENVAEDGAGAAPQNSTDAQPADRSPAEIEAAQLSPPESSAGMASASSTAPQARPPRGALSSGGSSLSRPFVQLGLFAEEVNAQATADRLREAGVIPLVVQDESAGRTIWRVLAGPAQSVPERGALLETARGLGFADAYPVPE